MTRSSRLTFSRFIVFAAVGALTLAAIGCDGGGSKRDSLFQQLVGTWRVDRVNLNGNGINFDDENPVWVEFFERNDDVRSYRIIQRATDDTTQMGQVTVPRSNIVRMVGEGGLLEWNFDFEKPEDVSESVRFRLRRGADESVRDFLEAIGVGGEAESLQLDFERGSG